MEPCRQSRGGEGRSAGRPSTGKGTPEAGASSPRAQALTADLALHDGVSDQRHLLHLQGSRMQGVRARDLGARQGTVYRLGSTRGRRCAPKCHYRAHLRTQEPSSRHRERGRGQVGQSGRGWGHGNQSGKWEGRWSNGKSPVTPGSRLCLHSVTPPVPAPPHPRLHPSTCPSHLKAPNHKPANARGQGESRANGHIQTVPILPQQGGHPGGGEHRPPKLAHLVTDVLSQLPQDPVEEGQLSHQGLGLLTCPHRKDKVRPQAKGSGGRWLGTTLPTATLSSRGRADATT